MPSHLHPRSRWTTSLFTTTLLASFLVVGMPHILPCPVPRTDFADAGNLGDGQRRRRRKRPAAEVTDTEELAEQTTDELQDEGAAMARKARECPVPKPGGLIGEVLGFKKTEEGDTPPVRLETVRGRSRPAAER
jgi:cytochrome c oxidase assembly factor 2